LHSRLKKVLEIIDGASVAVTAAWEQLPDIFQQVQTYFFVYHLVTLFGAIMGSLTLTFFLVTWWKIYLSPNAEVTENYYGKLKAREGFSASGVLIHIISVIGIPFCSFLIYTNLIGAINVKAAPKAYLLMKVVEYRKASPR
jgi:hypothetical protein